MTSEAVSRKAAEILGTAVVNKINAVKKTSTNEAAKELPAPTNNPMYQVIFDAKLNPEEKRDALVKLMTSCDTQEKSREFAKQWNELSSYLAEFSRLMNREMIELSDTDTYAILQNLTKGMNDKLIEFNEELKPLTDIMDALYSMKADGSTMSVIELLHQESKQREENERKKTDLNRRIDDVSQRMKSLDEQDIELRNEKSLFGFGGIKRTAQNGLDKNKLRREELQQEIEHLTAEAAAATVTTVIPPEYAANAAALKNLFDLTSAQHKEKQEKVIKLALSFIDSAKQDIGEASKHLESASGRIQHLLDESGRLSGVYDIMSDALDIGQKDNKNKYETGRIAPEGESNIRRGIREEIQNVLAEHIDRLDKATKQTVEAGAKMTKQIASIKEMRDSNGNAMDRTRILHTDGVASIAGNLALCLEAVGTAALSEASDQAFDTIKRMSDVTDKVIQRQGIRNAMETREHDARLQEVVEKLAVYGETQKAANQIQRDALSSIHESLAKIREVAADTKEELKRGIAIAAESDGTPNGASPPGVKPNGSGLNLGA